MPIPYPYGFFDLKEHAPLSARASADHGVDGKLPKITTTGRATGVAVSRLVLLLSLGILLFQFLKSLTYILKKLGYSGLLLDNLLSLYCGTLTQPCLSRVGFVERNDLL